MQYNAPSPHVFCSAGLSPPACVCWSGLSYALCIIYITQMITRPGPSSLLVLTTHYYIRLAAAACISITISRRAPLLVMVRLQAVVAMPSFLLQLDRTPCLPTEEQHSCNRHCHCRRRATCYHHTAPLLCLFLHLQYPCPCGSRTSSKLAGWRRQ